MFYTIKHSENTNLKVSCYISRLLLLYQTIPYLIYISVIQHHKECPLSSPAATMQSCRRTQPIIKLFWLQYHISISPSVALASSPHSSPGAQLHSYFSIPTYHLPLVTGDINHSFVLLCENA